MKVQLRKLAHARSGDKGDTANVGLIALRDEFYPLLVNEVTSERVKQHFAGICKGEVERFELPNLGALNFLLHDFYRCPPKGNKDNPSDNAISNLRSRSFASSPDDDACNNRRHEHQVVSNKRLVVEGLERAASNNLLVEYG